MTELDLIGVLLFFNKPFQMKKAFTKMAACTLLRHFYIVLSFLLFFTVDSFSQTSRGHWILSGNADLNYLRNSSAGSLQYKATLLTIAPSVGYFVVDKFVLGAKPTYTFGSNSLNNNGEGVSIFSIGPFARYYLLSADKQFNIFTEAGYAYGKNYQNKQEENTFYLLGGPVLYFNTSVGLEFTASYAVTKYPGFDGINRAVRLGLGFQFYFERE